MKTYQSLILSICIIIYLVVIALQSEERHQIEKERLMMQTEIAQGIADQHRDIIQTLNEIQTEIQLISVNIEAKKRGLKK